MAVFKIKTKEIETFEVHYEVHAPNAREARKLLVEALEVPSAMNRANYDQVHAESSGRRVLRKVIEVKRVRRG